MIRRCLVIIWTNVPWYVVMDHSVSSHSDGIHVIELQVLSAALFCVADAQYSWVIAVAVISLYQTALSMFGLNEYILDVDGSRVGLFDANREGVCSCCGYLALYFAGVQLGRLLLRPR